METTFADIVAAILKIFNQLIPVLAALGIVLFMIGVIRYIRSEGEHHDRTVIIWSLVALFVLFSVWGILRVVCSTFTDSSSCENHANYNAPFGSTPDPSGGIWPI